MFFKLNVEFYPNSWNVYHSYGEGLLLLGKEKEGIAAYKYFDLKNRHIL